MKFLRFCSRPLCIAAVALVIRLLIALPGLCGDPAVRFARPDTAGYLELAEEFRGEKASVSTRRAPGFPALAAVVLKASGERTGVLVVTLIVISALTVLPVGLAARKWGVPGGGAALAMALAAFNLTAITNAPLLLSDTCFGFVAAWQLYFVLGLMQSGKLRWFFAAAAAAGAGALIRPINYPFIAVLLVLLAAAPGGSWRGKIAAGAAGAALFFLILTPWACRNAALGAGYCIDTNTGAMYHQNGAMLAAEVNGTDYESEKIRILESQELEFADLAAYPDEKSREEYRMRKFRELVLAHPWLMLKQHLNWHVLLPDLPSACENLGLTTSDRGTLEVLSRNGVFAAAAHYFGGRWWLIVLALPLLLVTLATYGAAALRLAVDAARFRSRWRELLVFLACVEYYLFLPGGITVPRYQIPALPFLAVLAAAAASCAASPEGKSGGKPARAKAKTTRKPEHKERFSR